MPKVKLSGYMLDESNAMPYIEFELEQKEQGIPDTEHLYTEDKYNKSNIINFENHPTGTTLITIINLYDEIIKVLTECKEMIYESEKERDGDYRDSVRILKHKLCELNKALNIISNFIYCFHIDVFNNREKRLDQIHCKLFTAEHFWHNIDSPQSKKYYMNLQEEYNYLSTSKSIKDMCLKFFDDLISEFEEMKYKVDNSFIYTNDKSYTKVFSGEDLKLSVSTIYFSNQYKKHPTPIKYVYKLHTLTDFFNCSIYHIYLSGKVIAKCKGCNKYFIPNRTNQIYCNSECRELKEERNADKREKRYSSDSYQLYKGIFCRLNRSTEKYGEDFENFKENYKYADKKRELEELYKKDSTIDVELELLKLYTKIDKELQEKYLSHTRKCTTSKYWVE